MGAMVTNILSAIDALYLAGARYVVVPNLPDLGLTPEGRASGTGPLITFLSATFNQHLEDALEARAPRAIRLDVFRLMTQVVNDPSEYGFTNVTTPCLTRPACAEIQTATCSGIMSIQPRTATRCSPTSSPGRSTRRFSGVTATIDGRAALSRRRRQPRPGSAGHW